MLHEYARPYVCHKALFLFLRAAFLKESEPPVSLLVGYTRFEKLHLVIPAKRMFNRLSKNSKYITFIPTLVYSKHCFLGYTSSKAWNKDINCSHVLCRYWFLEQVEQQEKLKFEHYVQSKCHIVARLIDLGNYPASLGGNVGFDSS